MEDAFFGRTDQLGAVQGRLEDGVRLLTVHGPGGVGKTRLVREALRELKGSPRFALPSVWVELSQVTTAEGLASALLVALGVDAQGQDAGAAVDRAAAALAGRGGALVVLDNFEQLIEPGAPLVARLLDGCSSAQALVTSRAPLGVSGEERFELAPFALPEDDAAAARSDSVRFLALRARLDPDDEQLAALAQIARRLDGLPLALELAAARLGTFSPAQLAARLDRPLDVLTRGRRDADPRQRSLRAALTHSWELLDERDRRALAMASAFAGAFSLDAAEAVLDDALDAVQALVEASLLVRRDNAGEPRFQLYESVRAFAAERAEADGAADEARARHGRFFGARGARVHARWQERRDAAVREEARGLEPDAADLARAAAHAPDAGDRARAALGLAVLVDLRGNALAALPGLRAASAQATELDDELAGWTRAALAKAERRTGNLAAAVRVFEDARALARGKGPLAASLAHLEAVLVGDGALPGGVSLARELVAALAARAEAEGLRAAHAHNLLAAMTLNDGDADAAWAAIETAQAAAAREGDPVEKAAVSGTAARIAGARGQTDKALALADACLDDARAAGLPRLVVGAHEDRGALRLATQDLKGASEDLEGAVAGARRAGLLRYEATATARLGIVDLLRGHHRRALERAELALERLGESGESSRWLPLCVRAVALAAGGEYDAADVALARLDEAADGGPDQARQVARLAHGLARVYRARGESAKGERGSAVRRLDEAAHLAVAPGSDPVARSLARALAREVEGLSAELEGGGPARDYPEDALVIAEDGAWFRAPESARTDLGRKPVLRSVLLALARRAEEAPEEVAGVDALFADAWPEERATADSRKARVRMAISALRKEGLKEVIETVGGGYRLTPGLVVLRAGDLSRS